MLLGLRVPRPTAPRRHAVGVEGESPIGGGERRALAVLGWNDAQLLAQLAKDEPEAVKAIFREHNLPPLQVHGHCHQKAIIGTSPTMEVLAIAGIQAELIDSACCGMAGTFGFEAEHYDMSKAMGSMKLFPAIEAEDKRDWRVAISGISCRQQIDHFTSKRPKHVVEYLADALRD